MMCYLADIPLRLAHCHENPYRLLTDWVPDPEPSETVRHEVQRQLDLVAAIGCSPRDDRLAVRISPGAQCAARRWTAARNLGPGAPWVVVHPGASAPSRRYPEDLFARVVRTLRSQWGWRVVLTGAEGEADLVDRVHRASEVDVELAVGRFDAEGLAALLAEAPLLISNNTGPAHLAAAVGTPIVDLYALTNPQHTPWRVPSRVLSHDVPCRNCYRSVCPEGHHRCLALVEPEAIVDAARDLMESATLRRGW